MKNTKNVYADAKTNASFAYYSKLLGEVFDTLEELNLAEEAYYAKLKAKEDKAAAKKADAVKVEEAFKKLNEARRDFKTGLNLITETYKKDLDNIKSAFEKDKADVYAALAKAEDDYSKALKTFIDKYPEGYHLTLKDGDFEKTITKETNNTTKSLDNPFQDIFDLFFN